MRRKEKGSSQKDQSPSLFLQVRSGMCQIENNTLNKGFLIKKKKKNIFVFYIVLLFLSVIFIDILLDLAHCTSKEKTLKIFLFFKHIGCI